jgi:hypothetical protein
MTTPFTNDIGQVINPGDKVVIVTTGYSHSVKTCKGTYFGLTKNGRGVQCIKKVKRSYYTCKLTGERINTYQYFKEMNEALRVFRAEFFAAGKSTEYNSVYSTDEYKKIRNEYYNRIEPNHEYVDRRTTLQRNRIYKLAA